MCIVPSVAHGSLKHRPDIDGLRAVAVLAVVVYHVGLPLRGGFVGVDVFFVISGFLISSIILGQIKASTFTFAGFYERRARRILPALVVVMAATTVLAYRYLLPVELEEYARSLICADLSISNFFFWLTSGYFDNGAAAKPLLHTWSLAVEEQFYIGLPLLFWGIKRYFPRRLDVCVILVALASFALSVVGAYRYPTATFYLGPTRAWELMLGTIVALDGVPRMRSRVAREVASMVGLAGILAACVAYRPTTVFPGLAALPPCAGAALIIAAGKDGDSLVGRLLSLKPATAIGLISYSVYLWHWPIIVFYNFGMTMIPGLTKHPSQVLLTVVSLGLGALSWRFVEQPFRVGGRLSLSRPAVFRFSLASIGTLAVVGAAGVIARGLPNRLSDRAKQVASYLSEDGAKEQFRTETCFLTSFDWDLKQFDVQTCMHPDDRRPALLILGDSHAAHYYGDGRVTYDVPGIARERLEKESGVFQVYFSGCGGDIAMGKYNDGSPARRSVLVGRLYDAMVRSLQKVHVEPLSPMVWRTAEVRFPLRSDPSFSEEANRKVLHDTTSTVDARVKAACNLSMIERVHAGRHFELSCLAMGSIRILHLPGEPFIEFQLWAENVRPNLFVAVSAFGDMTMYYIGTDKAYADVGGYEITWSFVDPSEKLLKTQIGKLLTDGTDVIL